MRWYIIMDMGYSGGKQQKEDKRTTGDDMTGETVPKRE